MENFDNFIGSIAAAVLKSGLNETTSIGVIVSAAEAMMLNQL
jgi:hypothetical protein